MVTVVDRARELLDLKDLEIPLRPKVLRITVEDYVDSTGDDALRLTLLIDDDTTKEELTGEWFSRLRRIVMDRLRAEGIELFPYISLATPCELAEVEQEEG